MKLETIKQEQYMIITHELVNITSINNKSTDMTFHDANMFATKH